MRRASNYTFGRDGRSCQAERPMVDRSRPQHPEPIEIWVIENKAPFGARIPPVDGGNRGDVGFVVDRPAPSHMAFAVDDDIHGPSSVAPDRRSLLVHFVPS